MIPFPASAPGRAPGAPEPGWYPDPGEHAPWRWWDGAGWTHHTWPPASGVALPWAGAPRPAEEPRRPDMGRAFLPTIGWGLLSMLAGVVAGIVPAAFAAAAGAGESAAIAVFALVFYPVMFGGFARTAMRMSRRHGTGSLRRDFGVWEFRPIDLLWGGLAGLAAVLLQGALAQVIPQPADDTYRDAVLGSDPNLALLMVISLAVVVGAPIFEELLFRGPLMRALVARLGAWPGIIAQAAIFAVYHVIGSPDLVTIWYLTPLFVVGAVFGFVAHRTGRLVTAQIAHATMNVVAFAALLATG